MPDTTEFRVAFIGDGIKPGVLLVQALRGDAGAARDLADSFGLTKNLISQIAQRQYQEDLERVALAVSPEGDEGTVLRVLAIAGHPVMSIGDKLRQIVALDDRYLAFKAAAWGKLLRTSRQNIERVTAWTEDLPAMRRRSCRDRRSLGRRRDTRGKMIAASGQRDDLAAEFDDLFKSAEGAASRDSP